MPTLPPAETLPTITPGPLLATIASPADVRALDLEQLPQLCDELRQYIVDIVAVHGGHFGASLGVVELTVALHWAYHTPEDQLVWDVGHQAYGHKILTGRREAFPTNRKYGGLSGFPKRSESEYDTFGVGHASTSISAALGMAVACGLSQTGQKVVAVIGDGSMTGGLAFEGMNNAGAMDTDLLVILNDNRISIDPNVGALHEYLARVSASGPWNTLKGEVWELFERLKGVGGGHLQRLASRVEDGMKAVLTPGMLFEALGFRYIGPTDGHDVRALATRLKKLRDLPGPILLHTLTVKGKGFAPAEADQVKWHAQSSPFDKVTGKSLAVPTASGAKAPKWQDVFGDAIIELAEADDRIVAVTAAMPSGTSLGKMMKAMPDRAFDVGIAEMHAVVFAAGMATQGKHPVCAIYSTFLQRAYDGVVHDVALQNLPVIFAMDRAGVAGSDGPTHHGALDIPYMRAVQGMVCAAPMDEQDLRDLLYTATQHDGPFALRYPRGEATGMDVRAGLRSHPARHRPVDHARGRKPSGRKPSGLWRRRVHHQLRQHRYVRGGSSGAASGPGHQRRARRPPLLQAARREPPARRVRALRQGADRRRRRGSGRRRHRGPGVGRRRERPSGYAGRASRPTRHVRGAWHAAPVARRGGHRPRRDRCRRPSARERESLR